MKMRSAVLVRTDGRVDVVLQLVHQPSHVVDLALSVWHSAMSLEAVACAELEAKTSLVLLGLLLRPASPANAAEIPTRS